MTWTEVIGYAGALCSIASFWMKTMIPLRVMGIVSVSFFIVYNVAHATYPSLIVNSILLPLNCVRLFQMVQLVKRVRESSHGDLSMEWLKPFMTRRPYDRGSVLFRKGEQAAEMFYTLSGRYRLRESGIEIQPGQLVGELGLLAPDNRRTQTLECIAQGEVLTISYDEVRQLYFQNPEFGFYFLRLTSARLFQNIARLERELALLRLRTAQG